MAEGNAIPAADGEDDISGVAPAEEPSSPRRRPRVADGTPRERRVLHPGPSCPHCGGDLQVVGEDVSELLEMIAAQLRVIEIARPKKPCRRYERMVQSPAPSRPIPGSMAGPGLLAHILVSKISVCRSTGRPRSSPAWARISPTPRWSIGAGGR